MGDGVLIIDKPTGLSSAQAVGQVKKILRAKKVGHAGTLDPFATGVLVCLVNQATRLAQFLLTSSKQYEAELYLGVVTDTQDLTGQVVRNHRVPILSDSDLKRVFSRFVGELEQTPPVYSALKHKGVALYKLAREGQPVTKPARHVCIEKLEIKSVTLPTVQFAVTCSAGTYIRTLCADIGQELGCGGHLSKLRRTMSSDFSIDEAISLKALTQQAATSEVPIALIPPGDALRTMPALKAERATVEKIKCGGAITIRDFTDLPPDATVMKNGEKGTHFKVLDDREDLVAIVSAGAHHEKMVYHGVFA